jgi:hypothetical protein
MPHLSSLEVHLLQHSELMSKITILLEKDNVRLKHLQEWSDQEQIFWKWMVRYYPVADPGFAPPKRGLGMLWHTLSHWQTLSQKRLPWHTLSHTIWPFKNQHCGDI